MVLHFDNESPHAAQLTTDYMWGNGLAQVVHPAFSLDLALSNFYVFGKVKMTLKSATFDNNELFQGAMRVLNRILLKELEATFYQWLKRLDVCIQRHGEYEE
jgi:hypothetical protein